MRQQCPECPFQIHHFQNMFASEQMEPEKRDSNHYVERHSCYLENDTMMTGKKYTRIKCCAVYRYTGHVVQLTKQFSIAVVFSHKLLNTEVCSCTRSRTQHVTGHKTASQLLVGTMHDSFTGMSSQFKTRCCGPLSQQNSPKKKGFLLRSQGLDKSQCTA